MFSTVLFYMPSVAFRRAAHAVLNDSLSADRAARAWGRAVELQRGLAGRRRRQSRGVDHLLRYGEWDCALYRSLQEAGVPKQQAGLLIEKVNWAIFGPVTSALFRLSRLRSGMLRTRVRWVMDVMFRVLFTAPFQRRMLPSEHDVAFEVTVCPLAQFCRDQGVPELTAHAACNMDTVMARDWGITLGRAHTIAEGHPRCDFVFQIGR